MQWKRGLGSFFPETSKTFGGVGKMNQLELGDGDVEPAQKEKGRPEKGCGLIFELSFGGLWDGDLQTRNSDLEIGPAGEVTSRKTGS